MKKIMLLIFLFPLVLSAQTHQTEIVSFVSDNVGKKVGKGICYELVQGAIRQYNPKYDMGSMKKDRDRYGAPVKKNIQAGDIVLQKGSSIEHLGIVYKVSNDSIYIAEQNTNGNLKKSIVEVNYLDYDELKKLYADAKVYFFRPE